MKELELIRINNEADLEYLIQRFQNGPVFAEAFVFATNDLYTYFLDAINADKDLYEEAGYYFDTEKNIHISRSEEDYVWISTMGLVAKERVTKNKFLNACIGQKSVLLHLLDDAISICRDVRSYYVESYLYGQVETLTPVIVHNIFFYLELLAKTYLSLNGQTIPHTHKLSTLLDIVKATMKEKNHSDTIFHAVVIPMLENAVNHISTIPGRFLEEYVKYDDNPEDTTIVLFNEIVLKELYDAVEMSENIIVDMYYESDPSIYFKNGLFQRLYQKCETDEAKNRLKERFGFLVDNSESNDTSV